MKRDVLVVPVADVARAGHVYEQPGIRLDIDPAHAQFVGRGIGVSKTFDDPDGNGWIVQQVVDRAPGR